MTSKQSSTLRMSDIHNNNNSNSTNNGNTKTTASNNATTSAASATECTRSSSSRHIFMPPRPSTVPSRLFSSSNNTRSSGNHDKSGGVAAGLSSSSQSYFVRRGLPPSRGAGGGGRENGERVGGGGVREEPSSASSSFSPTNGCPSHILLSSSSHSVGDTRELVIMRRPNTTKPLPSTSFLSRSRVSPPQHHQISSLPVPPLPQPRTHGICNDVIGHTTRIHNGNNNSSNMLCCTVTTANATATTIIATEYPSPSSSTARFDDCSRYSSYQSLAGGTPQREELGEERDATSRVIMSGEVGQGDERRRGDSAATLRIGRGSVDVTSGGSGERSGGGRSGSAHIYNAIILQEDRERHRVLLDRALQRAEKAEKMLEATRRQLADIQASYSFSSSATTPAIIVTTTTTTATETSSNGASNTNNGNNTISEQLLLLKMLFSIAEFESSARLELLSAERNELIHLLAISGFFVPHHSHSRLPLTYEKKRTTPSPPPMVITVRDSHIIRLLKSTQERLIALEKLIASMPWPMPSAGSSEGLVGLTHRTPASSTLSSSKSMEEGEEEECTRASRESEIRQWYQQLSALASVQYQITPPPPTDHDNSSTAAATVGHTQTAPRLLLLNGDNDAAASIPQRQGIQKGVNDDKQVAASGLLSAATIGGGDDKETKNSKPKKKGKKK